MKSRYNNYFIFILLFKYISLNLDDHYQLYKYGSYETRQEHTIFDPRGFNIGQDMYFKITSKEFYSEYLYYEYSDNITNFTYSFSNNLHKEKYTHQTTTGDDDNKSTIRYFTIVKKKRGHRRITRRIFNIIL